MSRTLILVVVVAACSGPPEGLRRPNGVCVDERGRLFVSDFHHQRVAVHTPPHLAGPDHEPGWSTFGEQGLDEGELWQVWSIRCLGDDHVVVTNRRPQSADNVDRSLWEVREFLTGLEVSRHTVARGGVNEGGWPATVASLGPDGWVLTDSEKKALLRFDTRWQPLSPWTEPTGGSGPPFEDATAIRGVGDELLLVEQHLHRVRRLGADGSERARFGEEGREPGQLMFPSAAAGCPNQWIAVADLGNYRVQRFDWQGDYLDGFSPPPAGPEQPLQVIDIAVSADCARLYLADSKGNRVLVTTVTGEPIATMSSLADR